MIIPIVATDKDTSEIIEAEAEVKAKAKQIVDFQLRFEKELVDFQICFETTVNNNLF